MSYNIFPFENGSINIKKENKKVNLIIKDVNHDNRGVDAMNEEEFKEKFGNKLKNEFDN